MALLEKIRVKLGVLITVLIAVALLSFIIDPSTLDMTLRSLSSKYDVGEINGQSIKYEDFNEKVEYYKNIYTMTSGSQAVSEEMMENIYNTAWQELQNEIMVLPAIKAAGVVVGDDEMFDLVQGKEISPVIAQEGIFMDASGNFSRTQLKEFLNAIPNDASGNLSTYWAFLKKSIEEQQYFTKYNSLLSQSNVLNPVELRRGIEDNNVTSNVDFVVVPFGFEPDTTITVSSSEVNAYYKSHKEQYKQNASRDVEFVVYEVVPSEKDINDAKTLIEEAYVDFQTTDNLKSYLLNNSDTPLQEYYFSQEELAASDSKLAEFAFETKKPTSLAPYQNGDVFVAARISDTKMMSDSVFVQHILLSANDEARADSLVKVINKGANFSELAAKFSLDQNPNVANPGDIGWMTQTMMIPGMQSVLTMNAGKCEKMTTNYGVHVVRVTQKTKSVKKVQLALLTKEIISSPATFQEYYSKANNLASRREGKIEKFTQIVDEEKLPVVPAFNVVEGAKKLSMYENTIEVSRWIYDAKVGDVSPIITVDNKYFFVVAVTNVREEGYAPVISIYAQLESAVAFDKRAEKLVEEVKAKIEGQTSMEQISEVLNTTVSNKSDVAFGSISSQSLDPVLVGAIAGAKEGEIVGPVKGNIGVYVLKVNGRETGAFYTEDDAKMRESQVSTYQLNMLPYVFNQMGDVKDNRARFF
ncbi:MAG: SurA N-terminal domain-containing protein [Bacteroidales bacterium]|nr:SurA N-terminal domain-containing protein [Bacteroidales bacterium]